MTAPTPSLIMVTDTGSVVSSWSSWVPWALIPSGRLPTLMKLRTEMLWDKKMSMQAKLNITHENLRFVNRISVEMPDHMVDIDVESGELLERSDHSKHLYFRIQLCKWNSDEFHSSLNLQYDRGVVWWWGEGGGREMWQIRCNWDYLSYQGFFSHNSTSSINKATTQSAAV